MVMVSGPIIIVAILPFGLNHMHCNALHSARTTMWCIFCIFSPAICAVHANRACIGYFPLPFVLRMRAAHAFGQI